MTTVYFIRHAEPDYSNHNDRERPLTKKGIKDSKLVTDYLRDKDIDVVFSSPYIRAVETIKDFADSLGLPIHLVEDFRERKVDSCWIEDFNNFTKMQWNDFNYRHSDGECLREVQNRNMNALRKVLQIHSDKNIIIGSHGTAISTIMNYFDPSFNYDDFQRIRNFMPWIVKLSFQGEKLIHKEEIDLFHIKRIRKAVGAIIVTPMNKFLLVHKAKINENMIDVDSWDFIKGGVKENETLLDALKREIKEETGIGKFVVMEELADKIIFEFPSNMKNIIGYDAQETTMYMVRLNESSVLVCRDSEIDDYDFIDREKVYNKLSLCETKEFWKCINQRFDAY